MKTGVTKEEFTFQSFTMGIFFITKMMHCLITSLKFTVGIDLAL